MYTICNWIAIKIGKRTKCTLKSKLWENLEIQCLYLLYDGFEKCPFILEGEYEENLIKKYDKMFMFKKNNGNEIDDLTKLDNMTRKWIENELMFEGKYGKNFLKKLDNELDRLSELWTKF